MITLETLFVANQAARKNLLPVEALRDLLRRLIDHPERVQLVRVLHEHKGVPMTEARALHETAQRYLRHRWEERYLALLRQTGVVPAAAIEPLLREQEAAAYTWSLGDRLVRDGRLNHEQHQAISGHTSSQLSAEEAALVRSNVEKQFAPILGAPAQDQPLSARSSGRLSVPGSLMTSSDVEVGAPGEADLGGATIRLSADMASGISGEWDPRAVERARAQPPEPDDGNDERTMVMEAPSGPPPGDPGEVTMKLDASSLGPPPSGAQSQFGTMVVALGAEGSERTMEMAPPAGGVATSGASLAPGQVVGGKYTLVREVGRGAMGVVFMARAAGRDEPVAIKVVQGPATEEVKGRFRREILVSQRIKHPYVIEAIDSGALDDGSSYMVMEFLEGESMSGMLIREGAQTIERGLRLLEQILTGLDAVHGHGIVHRDLKPENVQVLQRDGGDHVKLVDFGISRFLDQDPGVNEKLFVTMKGKLSGTPQYVAPEAVLDPDDVTTGHDVYACGVIGYELLTGVLPFPPARNLQDLLSDTVNSRPREMDEANPEQAPYPAPLQRMVRRLLEKDPELRPRDAAAALALLVDTRAELEGRAPAAAAGGDAAPEEKLSFTSRFFRSITGLFKRGS